MRLRELTVLIVALAFVAGCGEKTHVTVYEKGKYQGKPDTQPWAGGQFKGDQGTWEKTIKARTNNQNEYLRAASN